MESFGCCGLVPTELNFNQLWRFSSLTFNFVRMSPLEDRCWPLTQSLKSKFHTVLLSVRFPELGMLNFPCSSWAIPAALANYRSVKNFRDYCNMQDEDKDNTGKILHCLRLWLVKQENNQFFSPHTLFQYSLIP